MTTQPRPRLQRADIIDAFERVMKAGLRKPASVEMRTLVAECERHFGDASAREFNAALDAHAERSRFVPTIFELKALLREEVERRESARTEVGATAAEYMSAVQRDRASELYYHGAPLDEALAEAAAWTGDEPCACGHPWRDHRCPWTKTNILGRCESCPEGGCVEYRRAPVTTTTKHRRKERQ